MWKEEKKKTPQIAIKYGKTKQEEIAVMVLFLEKALADLEVAKWSIEQKYYDASVRSSYYAIFHAEIAALQVLGEMKAEYWGHDYVQAKFAGNLIRSKKFFPSSMAGIASYVISCRHTADYKEKNTSQKVAERCYNKAELLVSEVNKKIGGK